MSGYKRILVLVLAAVLALTSFPFTASAAGEDILEPAPEVILPEETPVPETDTEGGTAPVEAGPDEPEEGAFELTELTPRTLPFVVTMRYQ